MRTISALSALMMGAGTPAGATAPNQLVYSKPGRPDSASVGWSGREGRRCREVTPMDFILPDRMCGTSAVVLPITTWMRPAMPSTTLWPVPL